MAQKLLTPKTTKKLFSLVLLLIFLIISYYQTGSNPSTSEVIVSPSPIESVKPDVAGAIDESPSNEPLYQVTSITDGDTIKVQLEGNIETIRIVGINTPETVDPRKPVECYGQEASNYLTSILSGASVHLEADETQRDRDQYGRLLRFVFLPDGRDVGLEMIKGGFAREALYSNVPHKYHETYVAAQDNAIREERGLWNPDVCAVE